MTPEPSPGERFILVRLEEGKTHAEIAAELRVPESTVSSRCQAMRARGLSARSHSPGAGRPAPADRDLEIVAAWNDASLSVAALSGRTGLSWESLKQMATRLRKQGHTLIDRRNDFERARSTPHRPEKPAIPAPPRGRRGRHPAASEARRAVPGRAGLPRRAAHHPDRAVRLGLRPTDGEVAVSPALPAAPGGVLPQLTAPVRT